MISANLSSIRKGITLEGLFAGHQNKNESNNIDKINLSTINVTKTNNQNLERIKLSSDDQIKIQNLIRLKSSKHKSKRKNKTVNNSLIIDLNKRLNILKTCTQQAERFVEQLKNDIKTKNRIKLAGKSHNFFIHSNKQMRMTDINFKSKKKHQNLFGGNRIRTTSVEPPADPDDPQNTIRIMQSIQRHTQTSQAFKPKQFAFNIQNTDEMLSKRSSIIFKEIKNNMKNIHFKRK